MNDKNQYIRTNLDFQMDGHSLITQEKKLENTISRTNTQDPFAAADAMISSLTFIKQLRSTLLNTQNELTHTQSEQSQLRQDNQELRKQLDLCLRKLEAEKREHLNTSQRLQSTESKFQEEVSHLKKTKETLENELTTAKTQSQKTNHDLMSTTMEVEESYRKKIFGLEQQIALLTQNSAMVLAQFEDLKVAHKKETAQSAILKSELKSLTKETSEQKSQLEAAIQSLKSAHLGLEDQRKHQEQERNQLKIEASEVIRKHSLLQRAYREAQERMNQLSELLAANEQNSSAMKAEIETLVADKENQEAQFRQVLKKLKEKIMDQSSISKDLESVQKKMEEMQNTRLLIDLL